MYDYLETLFLCAHCVPVDDNISLGFKMTLPECALPRCWTANHDNHLLTLKQWQTGYWQYINWCILYFQACGGGGEVGEGVRWVGGVRHLNNKNSYIESKILELSCWIKIWIQQLTKNNPRVTVDIMFIEFNPWTMSTSTDKFCGHLDRCPSTPQNSMKIQGQFTTPIEVSTSSTVKSEKIQYLIELSKSVASDQLSISPACAVLYHRSLTLHQCLHHPIILFLIAAMQISPASL